MRRRVVVHRTAREDLAEQAAFLARTSPGSALRFLDAARATLTRLARNPGLGRRRGFESPFLREIRVWPVPGFERNLIFYRKIAGGIEAVRVLHGARDLPGLFDDEE